MRGTGGVLLSRLLSPADASADDDTRPVVQQSADDLCQGFAVTHGGQADGKTPAGTTDVGGGLGVEVGGTALGLGAVDVIGVLKVLAVVGDQGQIQGHGLSAPPHGVG